MIGTLTALQLLIYEQIKEQVSDFHLGTSNSNQFKSTPVSHRTVSPT